MGPWVDQVFEDGVELPSQGMAPYAILVYLPFKDFLLATTRLLAPPM
jgi:hypothetical protein